MDAIHLHLLANHIPILGSFIGLCLLIAGLSFKSREVRIAAAAVLLFSGVGGFVTNKSGEEAEDKVEELPGVSDEVIHEHEEMAEKAMPFIIGTVLLSSVSLFAEIKRKKLARPTALLLLLTALGTGAVSGYTGYLGGQIRHSELEGLSLPVRGAEEE